MKKIILLVVVALFMSGWLTAQAFDARDLNNLNTWEKTEMYFSLIGKPIPSNYQHKEGDDEGLYTDDIDVLSDDFRQRIIRGEPAVPNGGMVSFFAENGRIETVRVYFTEHEIRDLRARQIDYAQAAEAHGFYRIPDYFGMTRYRKENDFIIFEEIVTLLKGTASESYGAVIYFDKVYP